MGRMPTDAVTFADFPVALPEIVLAVGALVLLMIGAFGGERSTPLVTGLSIAIARLAACRPHLHPGDSGRPSTAPSSSIRSPA